MARKKQEIQLQREIETQEEWEEVMSMEGLWVVDVYQEWCGPCLALVGNFRRLKNELGDNLLNFAIAKADTIDALEKYRGRCEPTFLFYAGGILTAYIHGANAPKVQRVITEQLAYEHKVLEGIAERKEVKDPVITRMQEIESERLEEEAAKQLALAAKFEKNPETAEARKTPVAVQRLGSGVKEDKIVTVAIIKPDAVAQNQTPEIITTILEQNFEILAQENREITQEEAEQLYAHLDNESYYDDLIKFITSGPSVLLILTTGLSGDTAIELFKLLMGPKEVEVAKEESPNSIRALYGEKGFQNAIHGSDSPEAAARELAIFFPNFVIPTYLKKRLNIQRTLAIIFPEVFSKRDEIIAAIKDCDLKILMVKEVQLTKEQAAEFYKEQEQFGFFDALVDLLSSGPMLALGLVGDEAISIWKDKLGPDNVDEAIEKAPKSFRARFTGPSGMNQFHGSSSVETAAKEIAFFFPIEQTVAMIKPSAMAYKDEIIDFIEKNGYKIAAQTETVVAVTTISALYPHIAEMEHFEELTNSLTSGPSLFMVLSREDAINGWRRDMGEQDPAQAKEESPNSLRALYGTDLLNNALHGSSSAEHARQEMYAVFGETLNFNEDGTLKGDEPRLDETAMVIEGERNEAAGDTEEKDSPKHHDTHKEKKDKKRKSKTDHDEGDEHSEDDEKKEEAEESRRIDDVDQQEVANDAGDDHAAQDETLGQEGNEGVPQDSPGQNAEDNTENLSTPDQLEDAGVMKDSEHEQGPDLQQDSDTKKDLEQEQVSDNEKDSGEQQDSAKQQDSGEQQNSAKQQETVQQQEPAQEQNSAQQQEVDKPKVSDEMPHLEEENVSDELQELTQHGATEALKPVEPGAESTKDTDEVKVLAEEETQNAAAAEGVESKLAAEETAPSPSRDAPETNESAPEEVDAEENKTQADGSKQESQQQDSHQESHTESHQESDTESHKESHHDSHQDSQQESHHESQQESHHDSHQDSQQESHHDSHQDSQQESHHDSHQDSQQEPTFQESPAVEAEVKESQVVE